MVESPQLAKELHGRLLVALAVGVTSDTFERAQALLELGVELIVFDTAVGVSAGVICKM